MPTRVCLKAGCPREVSYRGRCAVHSRQRERTAHPNKAFYNSAHWKYARRKQLFDHPLCQCDDPACEGVATDVDHRVPLERGGAPYAPANLQSLTAACHGRKTRREQGVT